MRQTADGVIRQFINQLRARDVPGVLSLFERDAVLFGSEDGESAQGQPELRSFFARLFTRPHTYGWTWDELAVGGDDHTIWFVAPATVVVRGDDGTERAAPYRLSGVPRSDAEGTWRFALFNGAEPVRGSPAQCPAPGISLKT
jgi:ketosteroid isomerase-like protein